MRALAAPRSYYQRQEVCEAHIRSQQLTVEGRLVRFCQQVGASAPTRGAPSVCARCCDSRGQPTPPSLGAARAARSPFVHPATAPVPGSAS